MKPRFFRTRQLFRAWLERNHESVDELWVGFHKKGSGLPSITWPESVDEALCFGWIDGLRKSVDEHSYKIRFTPRRARSIWSAKNIARAKRLLELGLMRPPGIEAFERRTGDRSLRYSFEQDDVGFDKDQERRFRSNRRAWNYFQSEAPSYRRTATWWVISAKREETRLGRLRTLIDESEAGRRIPQLRRPGKSG